MPTKTKSRSQNRQRKAKSKPRRTTSRPKAKKPLESLAKVRAKARRLLATLQKRTAG